MIGNILTNILNSLTLLVDNFGYLGVFLGMVIESSFIPFPSEVVLIPAGALIAAGKMSFIPVLLLSVAGTIVGALVNFFLARHLGRRLVEFYINKYGKFLSITSASLKRTDLYFKNHGEITSFVGRLVPVVRQLISLPAGFSKMNVFKFILYTSLGAAIWIAFLIYVGYIIGGKIWLINAYSNQISILFIIISIIIVAIYFIVKKKRTWLFLLFKK